MNCAYRAAEAGQTYWRFANLLFPFENLGPSDIMIARTRRRLLRAARAFKKDDAVPPGVDKPEVFVNVRSGDFLADANIAWRDAYDMQMRAAVRPLAEAAE